MVTKIMVILKPKSGPNKAAKIVLMRLKEIVTMKLREMVAMRPRSFVLINN